MTVAVIVLVSSIIAVVGAAPRISSFLEPAAAAGERGCIAYQTCLHKLVVTW